jgi:uncharacterized protein (UPF0276 family)
MSTTELKKIPHLGAGIGLRLELAEDTLAHTKEINVLEIIAEHYFSSTHQELTGLLADARAAYPIIPHGVDLSIGSTTPIEKEYLKHADELMRALGAHYYSDHFALTRDGDELDIGHLSPIWFTEEMLENIVARVDLVQQTLGKPLVLENITCPFVIPGGDFEEPEFISEVCRRTGCGLLLDVTNVFINAHNFKFDAQRMIERYPIDSLVHVHLAGGEMQDDMLIDSHSASIDGVNEGVWPLFEWVVTHADVKAVIIERDDDFKVSFDTTVLNDLRRIKTIWKKAKPDAVAFLH